MSFDIGLFASVAIAANGVMSWWDEFFKPIERKEHTNAYIALQKLISDGLANWEKLHKDAVTEIDKVKDIDFTAEDAKNKAKRGIKAGKVQQKAQKKINEFNEITKKIQLQEKIKVGISSIWIKIFKFCASVAFIASIGVLFYSDCCPKSYWLLLLFLPHALSFLIGVLCIVFKLFPVKILYKVFRLKMGRYVLQYECILFSLYFNPNKDNKSLNMTLENISQP